jgi:hypothetical protein
VDQRRFDRRCFPSRQKAGAASVIARPALRATRPLVELCPWRFAKTRSARPAVDNRDRVRMALKAVPRAAQPEPPLKVGAHFIALKPGEIYKPLK